MTKLSARPLLDAKDLQAEYGVSRHMAYALLREVGVRVTPRRVVVLRSRLEDFLGGGDRVNGERHPDVEQAPGSAAAVPRA